MNRIKKQIDKFVLEPKDLKFINKLIKQGTQILDLNNYETEAVDIFFYIRKHKTIEQISKMIESVLSEAFNIRYICTTKVFELFYSMSSQFVNIKIMI